MIIITGPPVRKLVEHRGPKSSLKIKKEGKENLAMDSLLFLGLAAGIMVISAAKNNRKLIEALNKHPAKIGLLPKAISLLILTAQIPELLRMLEHASLMHIATALFLLAIVAATTSGTESELR